jgi:hypothetical protein
MNVPRSIPASLDLISYTFVPNMEGSPSQNEDLEIEQIEEQDFQEPILISVDSNSSRKRTLSQSSTDEEEDLDDPATLCPICNTEWTNNGIHRIVSIRCGHIFGKR